MSVVVNIVSQTASWIAADGRASQNGIIISENTPKIKKINDRVYVGYTGTLDTAEKILAKLETPEQKKIFALADCEGVAKAISCIVNLSAIVESAKAQFVVTGANIDGGMASYTIDFGGNLIKYLPENETALKLVVLSTGNHGVELKDYIIPEINSHGVCSESIKAGVKRFIAAVSKRDNSVNTNVTFLSLRGF